MTQLALDQSPPLRAPLRFFLTAPLFGILAGALFAMNATPITLTRWAPHTFAVVHLLALGLMAQAMSGAMLQLLPVAVGAAVPRVNSVAFLTHMGLSGGTLLLVAAFLLGHPFLFPLAAAVLLATFSIYVGAAGAALMRSKAIGPTLPAMRFSIAALAVTVILGAVLALALGLHWPLPLTALANVHAAWGLGGFSLCLLAAVAYLIVPMFQLTRPYPPLFTRGFLGTVLLGLLMWSFAVPQGVRALSLIAAWCLVVSTLAFVIETLGLYRNRRRRVKDAMFLSWRLGLMCVALGSLTAFSNHWGVPERFSASLDYLTGVFLLAGAFPTFISGTLYKIVPFLVWLHLSQKGPGAPMMNQVIGERRQRLQLAIHATSLVFLSLGIVSTTFATIGGWLFGASQLALELNLWSGVAVYRNHPNRAQSVPATR